MVQEIAAGTIAPAVEQEMFEMETLVQKKPVIKKRAQAPDTIRANFDNSGFKFGWIPTNSILVDPAYQRLLQKKKIIKMAHTWDQDKLGVFVVNKRVASGQYFVIDGQHRHAAMQLIENYPTHVYCQIFEGLTLEQEAQKFHDLDNERDNLTPGASFKALLTAKDPIALGIKNVAEAMGYTVDYHTGPIVNNLRAYTALQNIFRRAGAAGLARILATTQKAWPNRKEATSQPMLVGLEYFFQKYPNADDNRLVTILSATTPISVISIARRLQEDLSSSYYVTVAQTIRGLYNKKLRYKLPELTS